MILSLYAPIKKTIPKIYIINLLLVLPLNPDNGVPAMTVCPPVVKPLPGAMMICGLGVAPGAGVPLGAGVGISCELGVYLP